MGGRQHSRMMAGQVPMCKGKMSRLRELSRRDYSSGHAIVA
jgi:hypothetical protein